MLSSKEELLSIINKYNRGTATPEEIVFLEKYYQYFNKEQKISETFSADEKSELSTKMFLGIQQGIKTLPVIPFFKRTWVRRVAAAAAIIIGIAGGTYFLFQPGNKEEIAKTEPQEKRFKNDVSAPMKAKATITLADGSTVALDSVNYGKLATQGNVNVMVTADGRIVYKEQQQSIGQMQYNTLSNPRGSKVVDMTLADGSRVWLNAGSSVTYPVAFIGKERNVTITGEAYFEVAHNAAMPFKVSKGEMAVTVLGTHFNVNAFDDETSIKVTLLEGSVKVNNGNESGLLNPGQQAVLTGVEGSNQANQKIKQIIVQTNVDLDEVMAWKNGRFYFDGADIKTMMRQLSRWYNVDVEFKADVKSSFVAKISRDEPVTELLKILELTNLVHFKIEGNKIEVIK
jgi:ferric-dicitrate binding protein FerR (iron transport regulator)